MEEGNSTDPSQDTSPSNIFAKYAYQSTPEKVYSLMLCRQVYSLEIIQKTITRKRKVVDTNDGGSVSLSPNKRKSEKRNSTESGDLSAKTSRQQQGMKRKGFTNIEHISDYAKGSKKVKLYNHLKEIDDHLDNNLDSQSVLVLLLNSFTDILPFQSRILWNKVGVSKLIRCQFVHSYPRRAFSTTRPSTHRTGESVASLL